MDVVSNDKGQMSGIQLKRTDTGEESVLEVKGLFYGIGHTPNSQLLQGQIDLDSAGYILVKEGSAKTSVDGVFAAGDVQVTPSFTFCMELLHSLQCILLLKLGLNPAAVHMHHCHQHAIFLFSHFTLILFPDGIRRKLLLFSS